MPTYGSRPPAVRAAFELAYDDHAATVYAVALGVLADSALAQDIVQDVFLRLWRDWDRYDARRGAVGAYLRVMARSMAVDAWREGRVAGRARERLRVVAARDEGRVDERPAPAAERRRDGALVREGLMRLSDVQREAVVLTYWGGLTADQIAEREQVPLGTIKSRIRLGLMKLREDCGPQLRDESLAA
jgi:RNA polymerase sigma-70 factor (ECF subfamily)